MAESKRGSIWIGFDLGGTKMMAAAYDADFRQIAKVRKKSKGHEGEKSGIERISAAIREVLEEGKINVPEITGIGIGCPGPVDPQRGIILEAVNLGWRKVRLADQLEKEFDRPVTVLNDVDAGVYGEFRFGAAKSARCVVGIFPGTGIGAGGVANGEVISSKNLSCMEVGHIPVIPEGDPCGCGLKGCLETISSRLAISAQAAKAAFRGEAPHLLEIAGTDLRLIRSGALAKSIAAGDRAIEDIVIRAAEYLGIGVAITVHLLAPDLVVLGGGMVEAMPQLFLKSVSESANRRVMSTYRGSFKIVTAKLGDEAAIMGAAAWAERAICKEQKSAASQSR